MSTGEQSASFDVSGNDPNGLCYDPSFNWLSYTDIGFDFTTFQATNTGGIWCIDLDSAAEGLYIRRQVLESGNILNPNGCDVKNGILYSVGARDLGIFNNSQLITCDLKNNSKSCMMNDYWDEYQFNDVRHDGGEGIQFDNDGIGFITTFTLDFVNGNFDGVITIGYSDDEQEINKFEIVGENLTAPGDIAYDSTRDQLVVPQQIINQFEIFQINRNVVDGMWEHVMSWSK